MLLEPASERLRGRGGRGGEGWFESPLARLIVGLPPSLTSFRIISSESVCFANKFSAPKKVFFGQIFFGPL